MALPEYPIFGALTRPAINSTGIPQWIWLTIGCFTLAFVMVVGRNNLLYAIPCGLLILAAKAATEWDPNFFDIVCLWWQTKGRAMFSSISSLWGSSMLSAMPVGIPRDYEDITGAV